MRSPVPQPSQVSTFDFSTFLGFFKLVYFGNVTENVHSYCHFYFRCVVRLVWFVPFCLIIVCHLSFALHIYAFFLSLFVLADVLTGCNSGVVVDL